ncbi:MAG TPA: hypothetical protein VEV13_06775 [Candidatus Limnocylindria bacterium]|nr:hypothetical protein [Candidatus Limnocylindria bacterium]
MSTVRSAALRPRRRLAAAGASMALVLASGLALAWPGSAAASGYDKPTVEIVKTAVQGGATLDASTPLVPGESFDYVLTVSNTGSVAVGQVVVTDNLPSTVVPDGDVTVATVAAVLDTQPAADPVVVKLGSLSPGESRIITIPVKVRGDAEGCSTFSNSASVDFRYGYASEGSSDSGKLTLSVGCADLTIVKVSDAAGAVTVGDEVTFDLSVALADVAHPVAVKPVVVTDTFDTAQFAFVSASDGGTDAAGTVTWTLADGLTPGGAATTVSLTLRVLAPADGSSSATYTNTGCVSLTPNDTTPVVRPQDDCDTATVPVETKPTTSGLGIVKANQPTGVVTFGSTITYTLTASVPEGSIPQTEVVVTDTVPGYDATQPDSGTTTYVPDSATCVGATPPAGTCDVTEIKDGDVVTGLSWALGTIGSGESRQVTFQVTADEQKAVVAGSETVDFVNVAAVSSNERPVTPSNTVENTAVVTKVSDNTVDDNDTGEELPATGGGLPLTGLSVFGLLLVALGALIVRHPALVPASVYRGRHIAR